MGVLYCLKCKAKSYAKTFEKADELIDHAATSVRCGGNPDHMVWYENAVIEGPQQEIVHQKIKNPEKKAQEIKKQVSKKHF